MAGITIYKITNPEGKVYIGQTNNLKRRITKYRSLIFSSETDLYKSLKQFGFDSHSIDVVHELPNDAGKVTGSEYERFYMNSFKDAGFILLNMQEAGKIGFKADERVKQKISESLTGVKHNVERVENVRSAIRNVWQNRTQEQREAIRQKIINSIAARKCQA